jgi:hypothetical protein
MFETLFPTLEQLLQRRIDRAQRNLTLSIALAGVILLLYAYVSIGFYYATIGSIDRLARRPARSPPATWTCASTWAPAMN